MKRVLVLGANGLLGESIKKQVSNTVYNYEFIFLTRLRLDLCNFQEVKNFFTQNFFDIIINCSGYTNVDNAEKDKDNAMEINCDFLYLLSSCLNNSEAKLIHISTDYVFDGVKNSLYVEDDNTNPINHYGMTKLLGEEALIRNIRNNCLIIRTSWLYSNFGQNFFQTIRKLALKNHEISVVDDQFGSPTYSHDLSIAILKILQNAEFDEKFQTSIYHYSNTGFCSWYEFAKKIVLESKIDCIVNPISSNQYKTLAKRPKFSALECQKIVKKFKINIPSWEYSLNKCINS